VTRPALFRLTKRWFWGGVIVVGAFLLVLAVVNVVDALPFCLAVRRIHRLSPQELETLASMSRRIEQGGPVRWSGQDIPTPFQALKPIGVSMYPRGRPTSRSSTRTKCFTFSSGSPRARKTKSLRAQPTVRMASIVMFSGGVVQRARRQPSRPIAS
jgi:hypothetical protein